MGAFLPVKTMSALVNRWYGLLNKSPRMYFQRYPTEKEIDSFSTEEDARAYLNEYFTKTFPEEFLQFSTALVKKINWGS